MEMKITGCQLPGKISFNYEELKQMLTEKVAVYESMVYTEEQINAAKKDRADLNRLKGALNDERLKQEKEYMKPFNEFKSQVNEIIGIIEKPCAVIDKQVKAFEEKQKQEKLKQIKEYWNSKDKPEEIVLEEVFDAKWLNKSVTMKTIQEAIDAELEKVDKDLAVIRSLPSYAFEAEQTYKQTLDLAKAVSEAHRLQEQAEKKAAWEAEQAKRKAEADCAKDLKTCADCNEAHCERTPEATVSKMETVEPVRQWVGFQAFLSVDEAHALGAWLKSNGIRYKAL